MPASAAFALTPLSAGEKAAKIADGSSAPIRTLPNGYCLWVNKTRQDNPRKASDVSQWYLSKLPFSVFLFFLESTLASLTFTFCCD